MRSPHLRLCFDLCGLLSALAWGALVVLSRQPNSPLDPILFLACMTVLWAGFLGAFLCVRETATITFQRIFLWMLVFRLIAWFGQPLYDDDHYRHLWDSFEFAQAGSPYGHVPLDHFSDSFLPENFQRILDNVRNPQMQSPTQPLGQFAMLASYTMAPGELWPLRLLLSLADFMVVVVLMQLVAPRQSLLYGWCPLLLLETYFHLHLELFALALLMLSVLHLSRRQHTPSAVVSALAVGLNPLSLPVSLWIASKSKVWEWTIMLATLGAVYSWFLLRDGQKVFSGIASLLQAGESGSFLYGFVAALIPSAPIYGFCLACFLVFVGVWLSDLMRHPTEAPRFEWLFLALFFCLPVMHPWYLLWVLPWAVLRPRAWTFTALAVIALSYCYGENLAGSTLPALGLPAWVRPAECGAVVAVALVEWLVSSTRQKARA